MKLRDQNGWPVEFIEGRKITNLFRALIHTSPRQTYKHCHKEKYCLKVTEAYQKSKITSQQMHELLAEFDRI